MHEHQYGVEWYRPDRSRRGPHRPQLRSTSQLSEAANGEHAQKWVCEGPGRELRLEGLDGELVLSATLSTHCALFRHMDKPLPLPSNRSFGWTFSGIFLIVGVYGLWRGGAVLSWLLVAAVVTAAVTVTRGGWLTPLNRAWMRLGQWLGRVVAQEERFTRNKHDSGFPHHAIRACLEIAGDKDRQT
jgi:hypothetical protein